MRESACARACVAACRFYLGKSTDNFQENRLLVVGLGLYCINAIAVDAIHRGFPLQESTMMSTKT